MAYGWNRNQSRPQKRCWCGSGKKEKNCHGRSSATARTQPSSTGPHLREITPIPQVSMHPWGVPGEEHKIVVAMLHKGEGPPSSESLKGQRGKYRVQFLLARPGYPIKKEREHKFIDDVIGSSHLRIVKPEAERRPEDPHQILLQLLGKNYQLIGHPDKDGFLGKLVCELEADNNDAADSSEHFEQEPIEVCRPHSTAARDRRDTLDTLSQHISICRAYRRKDRVGHRYLLGNSALIVNP